MYPAAFRAVSFPMILRMPLAGSAASAAHFLAASADGAHGRPASCSLPASTVRISAFALLTASVSVPVSGLRPLAALSRATSALSPKNSSGSMTHVKEAIARFLPGRLFRVALPGCQGSETAERRPQPDVPLWRPGPAAPPPGVFMVERNDTPPAEGARQKTRLICIQTRHAESVFRLLRIGREDVDWSFRPGFPGFEVVRA